MEKLIVAKLISCILIWTTLIVENQAKIIETSKPEDVPLTKPIGISTTSSSSPTQKSPPSLNTTTVKMNSQNPSTTNTKEQKSTSSDTKNISSNGNHGTSSIQSNSSSHVINNTKTDNPSAKYSLQSASQKGEAEALRSISIHEETTSLKSSLWIYITVGVLCVAFINFYVWYRKRAATYSFVPTAKTPRR